MQRHRQVIDADYRRVSMEREQRILQDEAQREQRQCAREPPQRTARGSIRRSVEDRHDVGGVGVAQERDRYEEEQQVA